MFGPSSGFGVALHAGHRLIDAGPYALVRHPMYLAVMLAAWGSLMLYRTWATLAFAIMMLGVIVRARREERVLSNEFGEAWREYAARVPRWFPLLRRRVHPALQPRVRAWRIRPQPRLAPPAPAMPEQAATAGAMVGWVPVVFGWRVVVIVHGSHLCHLASTAHIEI